VLFSENGGNSIMEQNKNRHRLVHLKPRAKSFVSPCERRLASYRVRSKDDQSGICKVCLVVGDNATASAAALGKLRGQLGIE
jgi:hypothetical protein